MKQQLLIEFYDRENLENLISLTKGRYSKVVYLYFPELNEPTEQEQRTLSRFIENRFGIPAAFFPVANAGLRTICAAFDAILEDTPSCVIDITGGCEIFIAAAGYYAAHGKNKMITLQQYDVAQGSLIFRYPRSTVTEKPLTLQVPEAVTLHGAAALDCIDYPSTPELDNEILRLWSAVKDVPRQWNHFCTMPAFTPAEHRTLQEKGLVSHSDRNAYDIIAPRLRRKGIMADETLQRMGNKEYRVFSLNVEKDGRFLYEKGGNLLEMYCALAAHRSGCFNDCRVSVILDWDGKKRTRSVDVRNEVDVVVTHGHIPVFISCKNTRLENEHLYEIATMTRHYGGRYARPAIVSNVENLPVIRKRAQDMGILLIDEVYKLSLEEFTAIFRTQFPPHR